ncbi:MAG: HPr family phosphocarrier protein [Candidatus Izemoplasmataceae bacterium]
MKSIEITIKDEAGMHARPASLVCKEAAKYQSESTITYKDKTVNLKSILGVMSLGIPSQSTVTIHVTGDDEDTALENILSVFKDNNLI